MAKHEGFWFDTSDFLQTGTQFVRSLFGKETTETFGLESDDQPQWYVHPTNAAI